MEWNINRSSKIPIYKQIIDLFERKIICGEFPPGSLLPSERKLAAQLRINRMTVVRVYDELLTSGLIERKQGSGTRVTTNKWKTSPSRTTNWNKYIESGSLLPMYPLLKRIQNETTQINDLLDLSRGELPTDLIPTTLLIDLLKEIDLQGFSSHIQNSHLQGQLELREAISMFMNKYYNIETTSSSIIITSGIQQSLYLITHCLLNPGDAIAIESPSYVYSIPLFQSAGLRIFPLSVDKDGINPEDIISLHRKYRIKFVFLNPTFQNPTGTVLSESRRKRVAEISAELNIPISEGDSNNPLSFNNQHFNPIKKYDRNGNILFIGSLAKTISLNLGIGWIIGPRSVIDRIADARQQMDFGVSSFSQLVALKLLNSTQFEQHLKNIRIVLKERRDTIVDSLTNLIGENIYFNNPNGGFYIWCKINKQVSDKRLFEEGIKHKVLFMPGSLLGAPDGYVRLNYASLPKNDLEEAVMRFSKCLIHHNSNINGSDFS